MSDIQAEHRSEEEINRSVERITIATKRIIDLFEILLIRNDLPFNEFKAALVVAETAMGLEVMLVREQGD